MSYCFRLLVKQCCNKVSTTYLKYFLNQENQAELLITFHGGYWYSKVTSNTKMQEGEEATVKSEFSARLTHFINIITDNPEKGIMSTVSILLHSFHKTKYVEFQYPCTYI